MIDPKQTEETKVMWRLNPGGYCGVFMPRHVMQKLAKLNAKHEESVRATLREHESELLPLSWTLNPGYAKGRKQVVAYYPDDVSSVSRRIDLFKPEQPERVHVHANKESAQRWADEEAGTATTKGADE